MTQCQLVIGYQHFQGDCNLHLQQLPWRWRQWALLRCWYVPIYKVLCTFFFYQLRFQPPHQAINHSIPTLHQENAVPTTNNRKTKNIMEGNKNHSTKEQLPPQSYNTTKITSTTNNTQNTGQRNKHKQKQKMGSLHLPKPKDQTADQPLQTDGHRQCNQKHKHNTATHKTKTTYKYTIKVAFMQSPATHVNWRTSGKPVDI